MADDPLALDRGADHEAGHVGEEEKRNVEGVTEQDEAGALVGRIDEEHAALETRLRGDDPHRPAIDAGEAGDNLAGIELLDLEEAPLVDQCPDHLHGVVAARRLLGDDLIERFRVPGDRSRFDVRHRLPPVVGHVRHPVAGQLQRVVLGLDQRVAAAADGAVHPRPAHLLQGHLLPHHRLGHAR